MAICNLKDFIITFIDQPPHNDFDICIIGGGAVGLACANALSQFNKVLLVERHAAWGSETSSRNSEVIHAGLYYPPNSLKERLCVQGKSLLYEFCQQYQIEFKAVGKLIVAPDLNHPKLLHLQNQANRLDIPIERWNAAQLHKVEPEVQATEALWSPTTGIFDSHTYMQQLATLAENNQAVLMRQTELIAAEPDSKGSWRVSLRSVGEPCQVSTGLVINCAGLDAQSIANMITADRRPADQLAAIPHLHPCRGHYFSYVGPAPFQHLIYPLPEEGLAGLGIHATLDLQGDVRFGPDSQYLETPIDHQAPIQDYSIPSERLNSFVAAIQQYFPNLDSARLQPSYAGIRPKLAAPAGVVEDFQIQHTQYEGSPIVQCFGIESPGLTASLAIARHIKQLL